MGTENKELNLVKVKYYNESTKEYSPREYTYFSVDELQVGDIVTVPVRDTTAKCQVSAINVPESEISAFKDKVKTIPSAKPELPKGGLAEAAQAAGAEVKVVDLFEQLPAIDIATEKMDVALININPQSDLAVVNLKVEIGKLKEYAIARTITKDEDVSPITDDLSIIAGLKKSLNALKDQYCKPVKAHLVNIQTVFVDIGLLLDEADMINRSKITAYRTEQQRRQQEAEDLNRQAIELAKKQAEFSGTGEYSVDLTPIEAAPVLKKVSTDMGTLSTTKVWKWEVTDLSKVPSDYMVLDVARVTKLVKAGIRVIPGIRIFSEESLRINTR